MAAPTQDRELTACQAESSPLAPRPRLPVGVHHRQPPFWRGSWRCRSRTRGRWMTASRNWVMASPAASVFKGITLGAGTPGMYRACSRSVSGCISMASSVGSMRPLHHTCSRPSARRRGPLRGVAVIDPGRRGEELDRLVETGACGIRLNLISEQSLPLESTWKSRHSNASGRSWNPGCSAGPARWLSIIGGCRRPCLCPTPDPLRSPACWPDSTCGRRRPCLVVRRRRRPLRWCVAC